LEKARGNEYALQIEVAALVDEVAEPAVVLLLWFEFRLRLLHRLGMKGRLLAIFLLYRGIRSLRSGGEFHRLRWIGI